MFKSHVPLKKNNVNKTLYLWNLTTHKKLKSSLNTHYTLINDI